MGCYDIIDVRCPVCGAVYPVQSKSGECRMFVYNLVDVPEYVLEDANRHAPYKCDNCGIFFEVDISNRSTIPVQHIDTDETTELKEIKNGK